VSTFFSKIKEPVLANPKVTFPEGLRVSKMYPSVLPDLFKGEQLVLAGRYSGKASGAILIEGTVNGEPKRFAQDVKFPAEGQGHEFIPRLWATRRVGYLLDEIRLRGESKELKDEVVDLARHYSIVTPYTAYLIVEDEGRRGVAEARRTVRFESLARQQALGGAYTDSMSSRDGEKAVSGSRSSYRLKAAEVPGEAVISSSAEAFRSVPAPITAPTPQSLPGLPAMKLPKSAAALDATARQYSEQSRFSGGKTFFLNEGRWFDVAAQKADDAKKVRIQFGSSEYFDLLKKYPQATAWLSLGKNVQFVVEGTTYEVYE